MVWSQALDGFVRYCRDIQPDEVISGRNSFEECSAMSAKQRSTTPGSFSRLAPLFGILRRGKRSLPTSTRQLNTMLFTSYQVILPRPGLPSSTENFRTSLNLLRVFHSTSSLNEESYNIGGQTLTVTAVKAVQAIDRSVQHWAVLVDWDLQRQRPYVVVDPFDPQGLLYLSRTEYLSQLKVWASNDLSVMVIARPGSRKPAPLVDPSNSSDNPSQNSPQADSYEYILRRPNETIGTTVRMTREKRLTWKEFLDLRKWGLRVFEQKRGLVSVTSATVARTVYVWGRELLHYAEVKNPGRRLSVFTPIVSHLKILLQHNGQAYTVKRMKINLFVLYNFVVGNPLETTQPLGIRIRLRNGLPACLDAGTRGEIRSGEMAIIRVLASIFNLYKAMDAKHPEPDLSTILAPHPNYTNNPLFAKFKYFCREVFPAIVREQAKKSGSDYGYFRYRSGYGTLILSAGANLTAPSILGLILDAKAWRIQQTNWAKAWFEIHGDWKLSELLSSCADERHFAYDGEVDISSGDKTKLYPSLAGTVRTIVRAPKVITTLDYEGNPVPILGRLHFIEEAAGKVRVVAICDYWTQVALKPVHEHLFKVLRALRENDATFDQDGVVMDYYRRGLRPHWSFDLKAATDTIPIALYKEVLAPFLRMEDESMDKAMERVVCWEKILTDRDWAYAPDQPPIRYGCGQPMGALSSWASMALTHHALVQFSFWLTINESESPSWYKDYLILGDDVDIATSERVADSYRDVCENFGVKIGLAKSLHSKENGFEFANRRFCEKGDISPLSVKEELSCLTWGTRMNFADRIVARFGTKSQDKVSGWLRKVCTAPQWAALLPELTGYRSQFVLSLVKFCLLNPFYLASQGRAELNIDSIVSWISLLDKRVCEHPGVESTQAKRQLEEDVVTQLLRSIHTECDRLIDSVPEPFSYTAKRTTPSTPKWKVRPINVPEVVQWNEFRSPGPIAELPAEASTSFQYILECINIHNQKVKEDIKAFNRYPRFPEEAAEMAQSVTSGFGKPSALSGFGKFPGSKSFGTLGGFGKPSSFGKPKLDNSPKPSEVPPTWDFPKSRPEKKAFVPTINQVFERWIKLRSIPRIISFDVDSPIESLIPEGRDSLTPSRKGALPESRTRLHEKTYGPMREVCQEIGRRLGVEVPGLPYFNEALKGKAWTRALRNAVSEYYENRIKQDASPCHEPHDGPLEPILETPTEPITGEVELSPWPWKVVR
nr:MAG: putative RNA-dependent RNA polymerase [Mitoviridae sp.]